MASCRLTSRTPGEKVNWDQEIVLRLERRNLEEVHRHKEMFEAYSRMWTVCQQRDMEVAKLTYEKYNLQQNLDQELSASGVKGGDSSKLQRRLDELKRELDDTKQKLLEKSDSLLDTMQKSHEMMLESRKLTARLGQKEDEMAKTNDMCRQLKEKVQTLTTELVDEKMKNETLRDGLTSTEDRLRKQQEQSDYLTQQLRQLQQQRQDDEDRARRTELDAREKELREHMKQVEGTHRTDKQPHSYSRSLSNHGRTPTRSSSGRKLSEGHDRSSWSSAKPEVAVTSWDAHDSDVTALCFSTHGRFLATGGSDKLVRVWPFDTEAGGKVVIDNKERVQLTGCKASILSLQFDYQEKQVLAASNDGTAHIWSLEDRTEKMKLKGHTDKVTAAKYCEKCTKVVTGSLDRTLKIWDLKKGQCVHTSFAGSSFTDVLVGKQPQWATVVSGHYDKQVRFWDLRTNTPNAIGLGGKVTSLDQSPDGRYLLCCCGDDTLRIIDMNQKSIFKTLSAPGFHLVLDWTRASFSPCGQYVAAGSNDGTLFVWDVYNSKQPAKTKEHKDIVVSCCWHPRGQYFASVEKSRKAILWSR